MNQPVNWQSPVSQPPPKSTDWLTVTQLLFSGFFTLAYGTAALALLATSLPEIVKATTADPIPVLGYNIGFLCAILSLFNLASAYYSAKKLKPSTVTLRPAKRLFWLNGIIVLVPVLITIGAFVFPVQPLRNYLLPILTSLNIVIGVLWLIKVGSRDSWGAHKQRDSGLISLMTGFTIWFIMLVELVVLAIFGGIVLMSLMGNPDFVQQLPNLMTGLENMQDPTELINLFEGVISVPMLIGLVFLLVAVIVPIIEELFKTLGVWMLAGRKLTAQEGWMAGLVSGAGFALVEGLFYGVQAIMLPDAASWVVTVIGRTGGSLLHTFCGGLVGWAFAKTWIDHKTGRVVGIFTLVIFIHSIWNTLAIIPSFGLLSGMPDSDSNLLVIPLVVVMILLLFAYLGFANRVAEQA